MPISAVFYFFTIYCMIIISTCILQAQISLADHSSEHIVLKRVYFSIVQPEYFRRVKNSYLQKEQFHLDIISKLIFSSVQNAVNYSLYVNLHNDDKNCKTLYNYYVYELYL